MLDNLVTETGAAVMLVHHFPKGKQSNKPLVDRLVGSGVIGRDADTIIGLTEHGMKDCLKMEFVLRNFSDPGDLTLERQLPRFIIRDDLDPNKLPGTKEMESLVDLMRVLNNPKGLTFREVAEVCREHKLFPGLVPTDENDRKKNTELGRTLARFGNTCFAHGQTLLIEGNGHARRYKVVATAPTPLSVC